MPASRIHRIRQHYEARVAPHRETYDILDWSSREAQEARFNVLLEVLRQLALPGPPPWLLDVGCGLTDLATFLGRHRTAVRYVGADITLGVLAEARRRTPRHSTLAADVFFAPPFAPGSFDVCFCSGLFNLSLGNNDEFAQFALPRLLALARHRAVANFLHCRTRRKYDHCHYYDPAPLMAALARQGVKVTLVDDYLENDFTLVLQR